MFLKCYLTLNHFAIKNIKGLRNNVNGVVVMLTYVQIFWKIETKKIEKTTTNVDTMLNKIQIMLAYVLVRDISALAVIRISFCFPMFSCCVLINRWNEHTNRHVCTHSFSCSFAQTIKQHINQLINQVIYYSCDHGNKPSGIH